MSLVVGAEPREVMPLVNYQANAEALWREIHEVAGSKRLAKQVLRPQGSRILTLPTVPVSVGWSNSAIPFFPLRPLALRPR